MKRRNRTVSFIMMLFICIFVLIPNAILIKANTTDLPRVYDYADLLSDSEEDLLEQQFRTTSDNNNVDVIAYTIESTNGPDLSNYAETLAKSSFSKDIVIVVINMDPLNREVVIHAFGTSETYFNSKRCQYITDNMVDNLKDENYYDALLYFDEKVNYFFDHKKPIVTGSQLAIELGAALVLALIVVLCMVLGAGGKNTTTCNTYLDASTSKVLAKRDTYTHTTTTRTKIERNNSSSGGGGKGGGGGSTGRSSF